MIEASETRWTNFGSQVYVKGMLVAFLYDLKIRKESGGKLTLADRYRELFSRRVAANANGNEVIIAVLDSAPAMSGFAKSYIESSTEARTRAGSAGVWTHVGFVGKEVSTTC